MSATVENPRPRILVTGASGFLGHFLVVALERIATVLKPTIDGRRADLLSAEDRARLIATNPADILIHLAWTTAHGKFWSDPQNTAWQAASTDLFARFYAAGGQRIIGIGSCAEYDWTTLAKTFAEDARLAPHTAYGAAKVRTAESLKKLADQHHAMWAWGRVFFSFGPGEPKDRLIPLILNAVRNASPLGIGPGATIRDFCAVHHVAGAAAALALSDVQGPVNLAGGHPSSFADLAAIADAFHPGAPLIQPDSRPLGPGEPEVLVADTSRLVNEVGFRPPDQLAKDLSDYYQTEFKTNRR